MASDAWSRITEGSIVMDASWCGRIQGDVESNPSSSPLIHPSFFLLRFLLSTVTPQHQTHRDSAIAVSTPSPDQKLPEASISSSHHLRRNQKLAICSSSIARITKLHHLILPAPSLQFCAPPFLLCHLRSHPIREASFFTVSALDSPIVTNLHHHQSSSSPTLRLSAQSAVNLWPQASPESPATRRKSKVSPEVPLAAGKSEQTRGRRRPDC